MADQNYRRERIERLLEELRYEITRGMMEGEVDETLSLLFVVPASKSIPNGVVFCRFETRPMLRYMAAADLRSHLRLVDPEASSNG